MKKLRSLLVIAGVTWALLIATVGVYHFGRLVDVAEEWSVVGIPVEPNQTTARALPVQTLGRSRTPPPDDDALRGLCGIAEALGAMAHAMGGHYVASPATCGRYISN